MRYARTIKTSLCAALAAAALCWSEAPAPASGTIDITEAIERVLTDNLGIKSLRQEAAKAYARKVGADGQWGPSLTLSAAGGLQKEDTAGGAGRTDDFTARATLAQTLYSGGRRSALTRHAQHGMTIADMMLADGENAAVAELFQKFYTVVVQSMRIDAEKSAIAASEAHLKEIERMNELGISNRLEVIRAAGSLESNRADLAAAEGSHNIAKISLMNFIAMPPDASREVSGELYPIEVAGSREESLASAYERRADRRAAAARIGQQKEQIEIERSAMRPTAQISATAGWLDPYRNADRGDDTWRAELSLSIPVLDRAQSRAGVLGAQAQLAQDEIALDQKDLDIRADVESAWMLIETTTQKLLSAKLALELAEESLRLAEVGFQEGVTPQLDLLTAQTSLTEARLGYISSLYDRMMAVVALKAAEGTIVEWTQEVLR